MISNVFVRVRSIVVECTGESIIGGEDNLCFDLGCDELDIAEIVLALEEEFSIEDIPDEDVDKFTTVGDIVKYIEDCQS